MTTSSVSTDPPPLRVLPAAATCTLRVLAYCAVVALAVSVLFELLVVAAEVALFAALEGSLQRGAGRSVDLAATLLAVLAGIDALWLVVAGGLFIAWLYRARLNLEAAGVTGFRWARGWAIGGWLVPLAGLVIPYLVVSEVATGSDPRRQWWQRADQPERRSVLVVGWWAAWVSSSVVAWLAVRFDSSTADTAQQMLAGRTVSLLLSGLGLGTTCLAALLAALVVLRSTRHQSERAASAPVVEP